MVEQYQYVTDLSDTNRVTQWTKNFGQGPDTIARKIIDIHSNEITILQTIKEIQNGLRRNDSTEPENLSGLIELLRPLREQDPALNDFDAFYLPLRSIVDDPEIAWFYRAHMATHYAFFNFLKNILIACRYLHISGCNHGRLTLDHILIWNPLEPSTEKPSLFPKICGLGRSRLFDLSNENSKSTAIINDIRTLGETLQQLYNILFMPNDGDIFDNHIPEEVGAKIRIFSEPEVFRLQVIGIIERLNQFDAVDNNVDERFEDIRKSVVQILHDYEMELNENLPLLF